jgi:hypothetical protein
MSGRASISFRNSFLNSLLTIRMLRMNFYVLISLLSLSVCLSLSLSHSPTDTCTRPSTLSQLKTKKHKKSKLSQFLLFSCSIKHKTKKNVDVFLNEMTANFAFLSAMNNCSRDERNIIGQPCKLLATKSSFAFRLDLF